MRGKRLNRRRFLGRSTGLVAAVWATHRSVAGELPPVVHPRAISGDTRHEPDWSQRLTVTVGSKKADIIGNTDKAIQAAVDYVARLGSGSVRILPGEYRCINSGVGGILFRNPTRGKDFWAKRNVLEKNRIVDSGGEKGIAIDVSGKTKDVVITGNEIRETRKPASRIGIRIGADTSNIRLVDNTVKGFARAVDDLRV